MADAVFRSEGASADLEPFVVEDLHVPAAADHHAGALFHLAERDLTLVAVSRAPLADIEAFRRRINLLTRCDEQQACVRDTLDAWAAGERLAPTNQQEDHWKLAA